MGLERLNQINFIDKKEVGEIQSPIVALNNDIQSLSNNNGLNNFISNISNITLGSPAYNKEEYDNYVKYKTYLNENSTQEELNKERASNQSNWEKFGRSLGQILENEVILGSIKGFGDIFDAIANIGNEYNDYNSKFTLTLQNAIDKNKERLEIYRRNPNKSFDWGDFGWWTDNFVTVGSTLSLLIPSMGITAGVGKIGRLLSLDSKVNRLLTAGAKFSKLKHPNYVTKELQNIGKVSFTASMSRIAESYQESQQTYKQIKEDTLNTLNNYTDKDYKRLNDLYPEYAGLDNEEIASRIASRGANKTFWTDMELIGIDILQYNTLAKMLKGVKPSAYGRVKNQIAERNSRLKLAGAADADLESLSFGHITKEMFKDGLTHPQRILASIPFNEGLEEMYQGYNAGRGEDLAKMIVEKGYQAKTIDSYLRDPEIWEQGFWGLMGGIVFQGAGNVVGAIKNKIQTNLDNKDVVDDSKRIYRTIDDKTYASITTRFDKMQRVIEDLTQIDIDNVVPEGYANRYETDENTKIKTDEAGVPIIRKITEEEREQLKGDIIKNFLNDFVMDSLDAGTYEPAKEFMKDPNFVKYFTDKGVTDQQLISFTGETVDSYTEQVRNAYEEYTNKILDIKQKLNPYAVMGVARQLTRREMTSYNMRERARAIGAKLNENSEYRNLEHPDDVEDYVRLSMLQDGLTELEKEGLMLDAMCDQGHISKVAYDNYKNELRDKKVAYINSLNSVNDKIDFKQSILDLMKEVNDIFKQDKNVEVYNTSVNNILQALEQHIGAYFTNNTGIGNTHVSEVLKKDIYAKTYNEFNSEYIKQQLPKTREDFVNEYNDMYDAISKYQQDKEDKALELVSKYLEKADNTEEAWENLMKNNVADKKLKDALETLNLGHNSTYSYFIALKNLKDDIIKKKNREANSATVAGNNVEGERAAQTNKELEADRNEAEEERDKEESFNTNGANVSHPVEEGDDSVSPPQDFIDDIGDSVAEEQEPQIDEATEDYLQQQAEYAEKEAERIEAQAKDTYIPDDPFMPTEVVIQGIIFNEFGKPEVTQIIRRIRNVGDAAFNELYERLKNIADEENMGELSDKEINKIIFNFLKSIITFKVKQSSNSRLQNLLDQLKAGGTITINGEDILYTKFSSNVEAYSLIKSILDEYALQSHIIKDSKKIIRLDSFLDDIINNNDISYAEARTIFAYLKEYLENNEVTDYIVDATYFGKGKYTVDELIKTLDLKRKQIRSISEYLHIVQSNNSDINIVHSLLEKHRLDKEKYPIVVVPTKNAISFRINNVEIGYLSRAESITGVAKNGFLQQKNTFGFFNAITKEDGGNIWSVFDKWLIPLSQINTNAKNYIEFMSKQGVDITLEDAIKSIVFDNDIFASNDISKLGTKEDFIEFFKILYRANNLNSIYGDKKLLKQLQENKIFASLISENGLKNDNGKLISNETSNAYSLFRIKQYNKTFVEGDKEYYDINDFTEKDYDIVAARVVAYLNSIIFNQYSYNKWKENLHNNLSKTIEIQNEIDDAYTNDGNDGYKLKDNINKQVVANLIMNGVEVVNPGKTNIGELSSDNGGHMNPTDNPLVFITGEETEAIVEGRDGYTKPTGFPRGTTGVLTHMANGYPIIAPISKMNKIYDKELGDKNTIFGIAVRNELFGAIDDWRAGKIDLIGLSEVFENIGNSQHSPFGYGIVTKVDGSGNILNIYRVPTTKEKLESKTELISLATLYNENKKKEKCVSIVLKNAAKNNKNVAFYNSELNDKYESAHKYAKSPSEILTDIILNNITFSNSFVLNYIKENTKNSNPYFVKEKKKYRVHFPKRNSIGIEFNETYDSFTEFYMRNNAAVVDTSWNEKRKSYTTLGDRWDGDGIYVTTSIQKVINFKESALSEKGVDIDSIKDYFSKLKNGNKININKLLEKVNTNEDIIKFLDESGVELLPKEIYYDANIKSSLAGKNKKGIFITDLGIKDVIDSKDSIRTLFRILLHEKLHENLTKTKANNFTDEQKKDLLDTYNQFVAAINSEEFKAKCNPEAYNELKNTVDSLQLIYEPMLANEERHNEFLEEWFVDSVTIPQVVEAMSIIEYKGTINETTKKNKIQTILDKLLELIEKIFNIIIDKTLKNSILEKQKSIFNRKQNTNKQGRKNNINKQETKVQNLIEPTLFNEEESSNNTIEEETKQETQEVKQEETKENNKKEINTAEETKQEETENTTEQSKEDITQEEESEEYEEYNNYDEYSDESNIFMTRIDSKSLNITADKNKKTIKNTEEVKSTNAKEEAINNYNDNNRETNPNGFTPIKNIDDFIAQYPIETQPIIRRMIDNGAIEVLCA